MKRLTYFFIRYLPATTLWAKARRYSNKARFSGLPASSARFISPTLSQQAPFGAVHLAHKVGFVPLAQGL
jgi:hypothetical protein